MPYIRWLLVLGMIPALIICQAACGGGGDDDSGNDDAGDDTVADDDTTPDDVDDDTGADDTSLDDDSGNNDDTLVDDDADDDTLVVFDIDFEEYELGPLGAPWDVPILSGASTAQIIELSKNGSGKALRIDGGTALNDTVGCGYRFADTAADMRFDADLRAASGATFGFRVLQHRQSGWVVEAEVSIDVGEGLVIAHDFSDLFWTQCGPVINDDWMKLSLQFNYNNAVYDVLINDEASSCAGMRLAHVYPRPFGAIGVIDYNPDGLGGIVDFDNFKGKVILHE